MNYILGDFQFIKMKVYFIVERFKQKRNELGVSTEKKGWVDEMRDWKIR